MPPTNASGRVARMTSGSADALEGEVEQEEDGDHGQRAPATTSARVARAWLSTRPPTSTK